MNLNQQPPPTGEPREHHLCEVLQIITSKFQNISIETFQTSLFCF